ncbi:hypothetical protein EXIGLDRAFT_725587 [Exidia glandulosa HHB12029]|uniref:Cap binding protein 80-PB n=1 Tax=Exidia glandulosa HHB12029 TaxID=1314781 RepID=A0A165DYG8_EXIGL|nr:hypothetical protein EXIGLDRAFT_725587 [Exidia glandulosa HHB12029]
MSYNERPSYGGGGGYNRRGRGGNRHDYERRGGHGHRDDFSYAETLEQRIKSIVVKFSDEQPLDPGFTPPFERVANQLFDNANQVSAIAEGFRIAVSQLPFKAPYYAALLARLYAPRPKPETAEQNGDAPPEDPPRLGRLVLEDYWKGFQTWLDKLSWPELRLSIHFFAHAAKLNLISASSLLALLQSFAAVLEEPGVSYARGSNAAFCVGEGIIRAWSILHEEHLAAIETMITSIANFSDTAATEKYLVQPMIVLHVRNAAPASSNEILESLVSALRDLTTNGVPSYNPIRELLDSKVEDVQPFELPSFLVPPDVLDMDSLSDGAETVVGDKKDDLPAYLIRLFDNTMTPDPTTSTGYTIRTLISHVTNIFEVNRKEAARLLLELPKWLERGTFKSTKPDAAKVEESEQAGPQWLLENTLIETILSMAFYLPSSPHKLIYYISLISELCKLSPTTVGPAVGKSIRKLYTSLGDGLDVEVARRFTEWFATHMSNFGYAWVWKEWIPDIALPAAHPRRAFIRRAIELEIRMSYYDRIVKSLPEQFQAPEAEALPTEAPAITFEYEDPTNPHHDVAQTILGLLRDRTKAEQVITETETLRNQLQESGDARADSVVRAITLQALLNVGSRSFSHLLNAIERYLPVLRSLVASGGEARAEVLKAVGAFWARSGQMVAIVVDKLMQYQIVEPADVVSFAFASSETSHATQWELVRAALDKANGRTRIASRRLAAIRKEEEDARAKKMVAAMDVDASESAAPATDEPTADSEAVISAKKACEVLARDQRTALAKTLECFIQRLTDPAAPRAVLEPSSWDARESWGAPEWHTWQAWCWYRHFCRAYAPYLRAYAQSLSIVSFAALPPPESDAVSALLRRTWSIAVEGGEP